MADYETYWRPKTVIHTVNSGEVSSGVAGVVFINKNNTDELAYQINVKTSANVLKTDFKTFYEKVSGIVYVQNGSSSLVQGDIITLTGSFYV